MARLIYTTTETRMVRRDDKEIEVERMVQTLALRQGQKLFVRQIISPMVYDLAHVEELRDGHALVVFDQDVIVSVEGLNENLLTCTNLRFARLNPATQGLGMKLSNKAESGQNAFHNRPVRFVGWKRLLAALYQRGDKPALIVGGLRYARAINGKEVIVASPARNKRYNSLHDVPYCFIVPKDDVQLLLLSLNGSSPRSSTHSYVRR